MHGRTSALLAVLRSSVLRRIEFAFLAFSVGEWATWLAVVVYAYGRGGATEAGLIAFVQLVPSIVVAPGVSVLGDRFPRARVLFGSYVLQSAAMLATAVALVDGSPIVVYVLATVTATTVTLTRPVQASLLPEVVRTPDELTASNVASGIVEGAGALIGPILAGVLISTGGPALVFATTSVGLAFAAVVLVPVVRRTRDVEVDTERRMSLGAIRHELAGGVAAVAHDGRLRAVIALLGFAMGLLGALDIFYAVLAIEMLHLDESAIGFLAAGTGFGALIGSATAVVLVGRQRLGGPLLLSAAVFGGSVAAIAFAPGAATALVLLAVAGIGSSLTYVGIQTLTQRIAGDDVMSRVFGVEEAVMMAAQSVGALVVPVLLVVLAPAQAIVVAGLALPAVAVLVAPTILRGDRLSREHGRALHAIQRVPMFMPLAAPVIEQLAAGAVIRSAAAGEAIVTEGEPGDRFYVVERGEVEVRLGGSVVRREGPGESFGEIALLRDVPRTATVVAQGPVELVVVERAAFLEALTGQSRSRWLAGRQADDRLQAAPPIGGGDGA